MRRFCSSTTASPLLMACMRLFKWTRRLPSPGSSVVCVMKPMAPTNASAMLLIFPYSPTKWVLSASVWEGVNSPCLPAMGRGKGCVESSNQGGTRLSMSLMMTVNSLSAARSTYTSFPIKFSSRRFEATVCNSCCSLTRFHCSTIGTALPTVRIQSCSALNAPSNFAFASSSSTFAHGPFWPNHVGPSGSA